MFRAMSKGVEGKTLRLTCGVSCALHLMLLGLLVFYKAGVSPPPPSFGSEVVWFRIALMPESPSNGLPETGPVPPVRRVFPSAVQRTEPGKAEEAKAVSVPEDVVAGPIPLDGPMASGGEYPPVDFAGFQDPGSEAGGAEMFRFREAILERLRKNRTYPISARKRGIEGDVRLRFQVYPDGGVEDIAANDKTGRFTLLEGAAVDLVRSNAPFLPVPETLKPRGVVVELTISYRLKDSPGKDPSR
ncbi:MAG: TonB family protein [Nitrospirae bacterium]|nr:TonB family protein [Nitrospirota bacterium]